MANINRRNFLGSLGAVAVGGGLSSLAPQAAESRAVTAPPASTAFTINLMPSGKDDTAALQAAIDHCIIHKLGLRLAPGVFHISKALEINTCVDMSIVGMGPADPNGTDGWAKKGRTTGTCLLWTGPKGGTMVRLTAALWPTLAGLQFQAANVAAVCIQMHTVPGWPTSGVHLREIAVSQATVAGIQFETPGLPQGDNTDVSDFETILLDRCAVGIRVCNDQSVGHYWRRIDNSFCPVGIEFLQGGEVVVEKTGQAGSGSADAVFFRTHGGGENAAVIKLDGIHIEYGMVLDSRKTFGAIVVLLSGIQDSRSDSNPPPLCMFGDQTTATLMASQLKGPLVASPRASVTLIGCTYVTASVSHPVRKLVQGTKKVHVI